MYKEAKRHALYHTYGWTGNADEYEGFLNVKPVHSFSLIAIMAKTFPAGRVRLASQDKKGIGNS